MTVALIPLRGGSKSIPNKNIKPIGGKPLCGWVIEAALSSRLVEDVFVSTECSNIKKVIKELGYNVKFIDRPEEYATDTASTESVIIDFLNKFLTDKVVTIQATSPMLTSIDLDLAINKFEKEKADSLLSVARVKHFFWDDNVKPINYDPMNRPRRQDFNGTLIENGAFYITKKNIIEKYKCRLGGKIIFYEMPVDTYWEIDELSDWEFVENMLLKKLNK